MKRILYLFQLLVVATLFVGCDKDDDTVADNLRPTNTYKIYGKGGNDYIAGSKLYSAQIYYEEGYIATYATSSYGSAAIFEIRNYTDESTMETLSYEKNGKTKYFNDYRYTMSFDAVVSTDKDGNETLVRFEITDIDGSVYFDYISSPDSGVDTSILGEYLTGNSEFHAWLNYGEDNQSEYYGVGSDDTGMFVYPQVRYVE